MKRRPRIWSFPFVFMLNIVGRIVRRGIRLALLRKKIPFLFVVLLVLFLRLRGGGRRFTRLVRLPRWVVRSLILFLIVSSRLIILIPIVVFLLRSRVGRGMKGRLFLVRIILRLGTRWSRRER